MEEKIEEIGYKEWIYAFTNMYYSKSNSDKIEQYI